MKKSNKEEFIAKAIAVHGNKYDYSKVNYTVSANKVIIGCKIHGDFEQQANSHLQGYGCLQCGNDTQRHTIKSFINRANDTHNGKYDYSKSKYINIYTSVVITCPVHGDFEQIPDAHIRGSVCPKCDVDSRFLNTDEFVKKAIAVHGGKYLYSKVRYTDSRRKVTITCPIHGDFDQQASNHLSGRGCVACFTESMVLSTEQFIEKARAVHGGMYDYSKVEYVKSSDKVTIVCRKHGDFTQKPNNHLNGGGCHVCRSSKGELAIVNILDKNNISYISQHKLPLYNFRYDFYLPDYDLLIEFHGGQHYKPVKYFGGEEGFKQTQFRDKFKRALAKEHRIPLLTINYKQHKYLTISAFESFLLRSLKRLRPGI